MAALIELSKSKGKKPVGTRLVFSLYSLRLSTQSVSFVVIISSDTIFLSFKMANETDCTHTHTQCVETAQL